MTQRTFFDNSDMLDKLDEIQMSKLDRERARQIARRAERLVCLSFSAGRVPGMLVTQLRRILRPRIRRYSASK
jgi:hypothetical protein